MRVFVSMHEAVWTHTSATRHGKCTRESVHDGVGVSLRQDVAGCMIANGWRASLLAWLAFLWTVLARLGVPPPPPRHDLSTPPMIRWRHADACAYGRQRVLGVIRCGAKAPPRRGCSRHSCPISSRQWLRQRYKTVWYYPGKCFCTDADILANLDAS